MLLEPMSERYFKYIYLNSESVEEVVKKINNFYQQQADIKFDRFASRLEGIINNSQIR